MICRVLTHPRVPIISSFENHSQEDEMVKDQNINSTHLDVMSTNICSNVTHDQSVAYLTNGNICDKLTDMSPLESVANQQSTSNTNNENVTETSEEPQCVTPELAGKMQRNEEMISEVVSVAFQNMGEKTISHENNNMKQILPEGIKEVENTSRDECLSEIFSVSIPPEKRRKTENVTSQETFSSTKCSDEILEPTQVCEEDMLEKGEVTICSKCVYKLFR